MVLLALTGSVADPLADCQKPSVTFLTFSKESSVLLYLEAKRETKVWKFAHFFLLFRSCGRIFGHLRQYFFF
jgi:hypothetical protein